MSWIVKVGKDLVQAFDRPLPPGTALYARTRPEVAGQTPVA